jgi:hypothetical protein
MKPTVLSLVVLASIALAGPAGSVPLVNVSWDNCTGPVDHKIIPGQPASIYASVLGHDQPHRAYLVQLRLYSTTGQYPDAWRFEAGGCQGPTHLTIDHLAPAEVAAACPSFQGTLTSLQLKDFTYDPVRGRADTYIAVAYPNGGLGNSQQVNSARRYFLARWWFDGALWAEGATVPGVTCGRLEASMCIASTSPTNYPASWVDLSGSTIPWAFQNEAVTISNAGTGTYGCPFSSPAENRTWGQIKSQYR